MRYSNQILCVYAVFLMTSCFKWESKEPEQQTHIIEGILLKDCKTQEPVANSSVEIYRTEGHGNFLVNGHSFSHFTETDSDGRFSFVFNEPNWGEGGRYDTYFAEIRDSLGYTIVEGIKSGIQNLDSLYLKLPKKVNLIYEIDLGTLVEGDKLEIRSNGLKGRFFFGQTMAFDTIYDVDIWGSEGGRDRVFNDRNAAIGLKIFNSDSLRWWDSQLFKIPTLCDSLIIGTLVLEK